MTAWTHCVIYFIQRARVPYKQHTDEQTEPQRHKTKENVAQEHNAGVTWWNICRDKISTVVILSRDKITIRFSPDMNIILFVPNLAATTSTSFILLYWDGVTPPNWRGKTAE